MQRVVKLHPYPHTKTKDKVQGANTANNTQPCNSGSGHLAY